MHSFNNLQLMVGHMVSFPFVFFLFLGMLVSDRRFEARTTAHFLMHVKETTQPHIFGTTT